MTSDSLSSAEVKQATAKLRMVEEWRLWLARRPAHQSVTQATKHFLSDIKLPGEPVRSIGTLYNWEKKYKAKGLAGLVDRRGYNLRDGRGAELTRQRRQRDARQRKGGRFEG